MKVFVGGSRNISRIPAEVKLRLNNIIQSCGTILIGDANGTDKSVQKYLTDVGYDNVIVYFVGDNFRNNVGNWKTKKISYEGRKKDFQFFVRKDMAMSEEADYGFMLWDGVSKGTINNALNLIRENKKVLMFHSRRKQFIPIHGIDDLRELLRTSDKTIKERIISDLDIAELSDELSQKVLSYI